MSETPDRESLQKFAAHAATHFNAMLTALKAALPLVEHNHDVLANVHDNYPTELRRARELLIMVRNAIKSAEGVQS